MVKFKHRKTGIVIEITEAHANEVIRQQGHYEELFNDGEGESRSDQGGVEATRTKGRRARNKSTENTNGT